MSIFIPRNLEELKDMAMLLAGGNQKDAFDDIKVFSAFGDLFGGHYGRTLTQATMIKGKPTLGADAMAGICRSSGLVRFMRITQWSDEGCVMQVARTDEPAEIVHEFCYTFAMAQQQGLTNNRNWRTMPKQMCRVRCLTMALRAIFPDAVAGIYSADEIADHTNMDDNERTYITAQALGEDVGTQPPQAQRAPQQSRAPQPQRPQHTVEHVPQSQPPQHPSQHSAQPEPSQPVQEIEEPLDTTPRQPRKLTPVRDFATMGDLAKAIEHHGITRGEVNDVATRLGANLAEMSSGDRGRFFYEWIFSAVIRRSRLQPNWWRDMGTAKPIIKALRDEFPTLPLTANSRAVGQNLGNPMMWEALSVSAHFTGEKLEEARSLMSELLKDGGSQELMAKIARL